MNEAMVHCEALQRSFLSPYDKVCVLRGLDLSVPHGQQVAIMGASGSGKSTLLHILGGLDQPDQGKVIMDGVDVFAMTRSKMAYWRNRNVGFVYQLHHLLPEFSALENVIMPMLIAGQSVERAKRHGLALLQSAKLAALAHRRSTQLSGGEKQRIAVLRAMAMEPKCLLADEPTGNLDRANAQEVLAILKRLAEEQGCTLIMITHDPDIAQQMQACYVLKNGVLEWLKMPQRVQQNTEKIDNDETLDAID